jgi:hypothetical protein
MAREYAKAVQYRRTTQTRVNDIHIRVGPCAFGPAERSQVDSQVVCIGRSKLPDIFETNVSSDNLILGTHGLQEIRSAV